MLARWRGWRSFVVASGVCLQAAGATASVSQAGKVSNTIVTRSGRFFFDHGGLRANPPACSVYQRWVVDITTAQGQAMMALILTAQSQGKNIVVNGTGDCRDWADTEAIDHVIVP